MYDYELDREVERLAKRQAGAFCKRQTDLLGATEMQRRLRVDRGIWIRLAPDVYALASYPGTLLRQCWGAVLGEPVASVGGFTAAHLLGFDGYQAGRPEIVVPPSGNARSPLARVHRYDGAALTRLRGLPITSRAQTIFDIAPRVSMQRLERTVDDELLRGRLSLEELEERLRVYAETRRNGLRVMRATIQERRDGAEPVPASELERRGDRILRKLRGRPRVIVEARFAWLDRGVGRVDRFLEDEGIIVEFDGRRWHARMQDLERDRWRDNHAAAAGLVTLRFTYAHVMTMPAEVLQLIEDTRRIRTRRVA